MPCTWRKQSLRPLTPHTQSLKISVCPWVGCNAQGLAPSSVLHVKHMSQIDAWWACEVIWTISKRFQETKSVKTIHRDIEHLESWQVFFDPGTLFFFRQLLWKIGRRSVTLWGNIMPYYAQLRLVPFLCRVIIIYKAGTPSDVGSFSFTPLTLEFEIFSVAS